MSSELSHEPSSVDAAPQPNVGAGWRRFKTVLLALVIAYGLAIVWLWYWMTTWGDERWLPTLVLFGPRWLCALPLAVLVPASAIFSRWLLAPLIAIGAMILVAIMGFQTNLSFAGSEKPLLRVMTCNVEKHVFDPNALSRLIEREQPDVVALQEANRWRDFRWPEGWHVIDRDEFIVASRWPIAEREHVGRPRVPGKICALRVTVDAPFGEFQVFNVHFETPRPGLEAVLSGKTLVRMSGVPRLEAVIGERAAENEQASDWLVQFSEPKIMLGDFNMPVDSAIFRGNWSWLTGAFDATGWGLGFTKISEKRGWSYGARIDHVLSSAPWQCVRSWVGPDVGSDHLPLFAEFARQ